MTSVQKKDTSGLNISSKAPSLAVAEFQLDAYRIFASIPLDLKVNLSRSFSAKLEAIKSLKQPLSLTEEKSFAAFTRLLTNETNRRRTTNVAKVQWTEDDKDFMAQHKNQIGIKKQLPDLFLLLLERQSFTTPNLQAPLALVKQAYLRYKSDLPMLNILQELASVQSTTELVLNVTKAALMGQTIEEDQWQEIKSRAQNEQKVIDKCQIDLKYVTEKLHRLDETLKTKYALSTEKMESLMDLVNKDQQCSLQALQRVVGPQCVVDSELKELLFERGKHITDQKDYQGILEKSPQVFITLNQQLNTRDLDQLKLVYSKYQALNKNLNQFGQIHEENIKNYNAMREIYALMTSHVDTIRNTWEETCKEARYLGDSLDETKQTKQAKKRVTRLEHYLQSYILQLTNKPYQELFKQAAPIFEQYEALDRIQDVSKLVTDTNNISSQWLECQEKIAEIDVYLKYEDLLTTDKKLFLTTLNTDPDLSETQRNFLQKRASHDLNGEEWTTKDLLAYQKFLLNQHMQPMQHQQALENVALQRMYNQAHVALCKQQLRAMKQFKSNLGSDRRKQVEENLTHAKKAEVRLTKRYHQLMQSKPPQSRFASLAQLQQFCTKVNQLAAKEKGQFCLSMEEARLRQISTIKEQHNERLAVIEHLLTSNTPLDLERLNLNPAFVELLSKESNLQASLERLNQKGIKLTLAQLSDYQINTAKGEKFLKSAAQADPLMKPLLKKTFEDFQAISTIKNGFNTMQKLDYRLFSIASSDHVKADKAELQQMKHFLQIRSLRMEQFFNKHGLVKINEHYQQYLKTARNIGKDVAKLTEQLTDYTSKQQSIAPHTRKAKQLNKKITKIQNNLDKKYQSYARLEDQAQALSRTLAAVGDIETTLEKICEPEQAKSSMLSIIKQLTGGIPKVVAEQGKFKRNYEAFKSQIEPKTLAAYSIGQLRDLLALGDKLAKQAGVLFAKPSAVPREQQAVMEAKNSITLELFKREISSADQVTLEDRLYALLGQKYDSHKPKTELDLDLLEQQITLIKDIYATREAPPSSEPPCGLN